MGALCVAAKLSNSTKISTSKLLQKSNYSTRLAMQVMMRRYPPPPSTPTGPIGCSDEEKDRFWSDFEEEMEKVPADERCIVGRYLNGHVGQNNHVISCVHAGMAIMKEVQRAYHRVPHQEIWGYVRERGVMEKYVRMIKDLYRNVKTSVRSTVGRTKNFQVGVRPHQGSALSPLLFNIALDVLTEGVREESPWCLLYADDKVLVAKNREELEGKLERWRYALENRGLRTNREKIELDSDQQTTIKLGGGNIKRVHKFKYLGSVIDNEVNMGEEIKNRIQCGWNNWKKVSGIICDRKVLIRLKGRVHKAMVRPAMTYGLEVAPIKKTEDRKLNVTEMRILRWMSRVTKMDRLTC
ncbi:uncharacterized protein LOC135223981 [Macrobrachium nipponense]|uniref:uncharacterized protein LOC135223981 n=1 Tax=Macrobrachium nipponense TaxID=159736 RepID=UPI0030C86090